MPALLRWTNSDGSNGQCDSRCHNARRPLCECRCNGLFHGAGSAGTLSQILQETGQETLAELATNPPDQLSLKTKQLTARIKVRATSAPTKPMPAFQPSSRNATTNRNGNGNPPQWHRLSATQWTTHTLFSTPEDTTGHIDLLPNGTLNLTITGPKPAQSRHSNIESAKQAFNTALLTAP